MLDSSCPGTARIQSISSTAQKAKRLCLATWSTPVLTSASQLGSLHPGLPPNVHPPSCAQGGRFCPWSLIFSPCIIFLITICHLTNCACTLFVPLICQQGFYLLLSALEECLLLAPGI